MEWNFSNIMNNEKKYDIKDLIIVGLVVAIVFLIAGVFIFSMKDIRENRRLNNNPNMEAQNLQIVQFHLVLIF